MNAERAINYNSGGGGAFIYLWNPLSSVNNCCVPVCLSSLTNRDIALPENIYLSFLLAFVQTWSRESAVKVARIRKHSLIPIQAMAIVESVATRNNNNNNI